MTGFHRRKTVSFRPCIESLEDRNLLSTYTVDHRADDLVGRGLSGSLRYCIDQAADGDRITFGVRGTITLTGGELAVNKDLDVEGPGIDQLAVSGNHAGRVFNVTAGATVSLGGLTITDGLATDGAGILNAGDLTLSNDRLVANVAQGVAGGGLFGDGGGRGGGVENRAGATLAAVHVRFLGNQALGGPDGGNAFGGAVYNEAGTVAIDQNIFRDNRAAGGDGGTDGVLVVLPGGFRNYLRTAQAG